MLDWNDWRTIPGNGHASEVLKGILRSQRSVRFIQGRGAGTRASARARDRGIAVGAFG